MGKRRRADVHQYLLCSSGRAPGGGGGPQPRWERPTALCAELAIARAQLKAAAAHDARWQLLGPGAFVPVVPRGSHPSATIYDPTSPSTDAASPTPVKPTPRSCGRPRRYSPPPQPPRKRRGCPPKRKSQTARRGRPPKEKPPSAQRGRPPKQNPPAARRGRPPKRLQLPPPPSAPLAVLRNASPVTAKHIIKDALLDLDARRCTRSMSRAGSLRSVDVTSDSSQGSQSIYRRCTHSVSRSCSLMAVDVALEDSRGSEADSEMGGSSGSSEGSVCARKVVELKFPVVQTVWKKRRSTTAVVDLDVKVQGRAAADGTNGSAKFRIAKPVVVVEKLPGDRTRPSAPAKKFLRATVVSTRLEAVPEEFCRAVVVAERLKGIPAGIAAVTRLAGWSGGGRSPAMPDGASRPHPAKGEFTKTEALAQGTGKRPAPTDGDSRAKRPPPATGRFTEPPTPTPPPPGACEPTKNTAVAERSTNSPMERRTSLVLGSRRRSTTPGIVEHFSRMPFVPMRRPTTPADFAKMADILGMTLPVMTSPVQSTPLVTSNAQSHRWKTDELAEIIGIETPVINSVRDESLVTKRLTDAPSSPQKPEIRSKSPVTERLADAPSSLQKPEIATEIRSKSLVTKRLAEATPNPQKPEILSKSPVTKRLAEAPPKPQKAENLSKSPVIERLAEAPPNPQKPERETVTTDNTDIRVRSAQTQANLRRVKHHRRKTVPAEPFVGTPTAAEYFSQRSTLAGTTAERLPEPNLFKTRPLLKGGSSDSVPVSNGLTASTRPAKSSAVPSGLLRPPVFLGGLRGVPQSTASSSRSPADFSNVLLVLNGPVKRKDDTVSRNTAEALPRSNVAALGKVTGAPGKVPEVTAALGNGPATLISSVDSLDLTKRHATSLCSSLIARGLVTSQEFLRMHRKSATGNTRPGVTSSLANESGDLPASTETSPLAVGTVVAGMVSESSAVPNGVVKTVPGSPFADGLQKKPNNVRLEPEPEPEEEDESVLWFNRPCGCSCIHLPLHGLRSVRAVDQTCQTDLDMWHMSRSQRSSAWASEQQQWRRPAPCCCHCIHRLPRSWKGPVKKSRPAGLSVEDRGAQTDLPWSESDAKVRRRRPQSLLTPLAPPPPAGAGASTSQSPRQPHRGRGGRPVLRGRPRKHGHPGPAVRTALSFSASASEKGKRHASLPVRYRESL